MSDASAGAVVMGPIGRWLTHWSFWPAYGVMIVGIILVLQPWNSWSESQGPGPGVMFHDALPEQSEDYAAGTVFVTAGPVEARDGWQLCDGHSVSSASFPELARIGLREGPEVGSVVIPDLSGLWLWLPKDEKEERIRRGITSFLHFGAQEEHEPSESEVLRFWIRAR